MSGSNPANEPSREVLGKSLTRAVLIPLRKCLSRTVCMGFLVLHRVRRGLPTQGCIDPWRGIRAPTRLAAKTVKTYNRSNL